MNIQQSTYTEGDWIVHAHYGVGQVRAMEKKELDGEKQFFHRVKTFDSEYWLFVSGTDVEYIRPIASEYQIKRALTIIRRPPKELPENHSLRNKAISDALKDASIYTKARMIRDLNGKQQDSKLNFTEEDAFLKMKKQLLNEWSVVQEMERDILEEKLEKALETSMGKIAEAA